ncbi:MAG TPA: thioredoxin fold domain-containing protein [Noviherbaspirillum sp.]
MTSHVWQSNCRAALRNCMAAFLILIAGSTAAAAGNRHALSAPVDLATDGMQAGLRGTPVVILFSVSGCSFCDVVRRNYLAPMLRDLPEQKRPVIREVQINGNASFSGFHREQITHRAFAQRYGARFAPTVVLLDGAGNVLTSPIVGGDTTGLYGGYLDNAFGEAARKLASNRRPETSGE